MQKIVNKVLLSALFFLYVLPVGMAHSNDRGSTDDITFTLVDALTDQNITKLVDEATIDLAETGRELNIRADIGVPVDHMWFEVDGIDFRTEKEVPYTLAGDDAGDYKSWTLEVGHYTLKATAYDATENEVASKLIYFNVVDNDTDADRSIKSLFNKTYNYSSRPENLRYSLREDPTEIRISWNHPYELFRDHQTCIAGYKIFLDGEHIDTNHSGEPYFPPPNTFAVLTGLEPGQTYEIKVRTIMRVDWTGNVGYYGDGKSIEITVTIPLPSQCTTIEVSGLDVQDTANGTYTRASYTTNNQPVWESNTHTIEFGGITPNFWEILLKPGLTGMPGRAALCDTGGNPGDGPFSCSDWREWRGSDWGFRLPVSANFTCLD